MSLSLPAGFDFGFECPYLKLGRRELLCCVRLPVLKLLLFQTDASTDQKEDYLLGKAAFDDSDGKEFLSSDCLVSLQNCPN